YHSVASPEETAHNGRRCVFDLTVQCASLPFRPPRTTRKPRTLGPQTAVVVGPEGEEIWTDHYGQVKVHFHWDRYDNKDENSSCWIRVASSWASGGFGAMQVPRIGDEVIVDFINGDPDYPIITGRVYNAANMPPWKLPENATQMGFYSRSTPDGHYRTANILRFEDKADNEEIYIHAQKDRNEKTLNNHSEQIDNNWVQSVGHNKAIEVGNNHEEVIGGNMMLSVGPSAIGRIVNSTLTKLTHGIGSVAKRFGFPGILNPGEGNMNIFIEKNKTETVGVFSAANVGIGMATNVGRSYNVNAGTRINLVSNDTMSFSAQNTTVMQSSGEIHICVGDAQILMHKDGTVCLAGKKLFMDFEQIEINGDETILMNSKKIELN